ncbi:hypothetical protein KTH_29210 [Thermosporothrix hazakensis]|uniref:Uncharacterized protein n=1 Tax=Thermosporothrix sp. COM3 TaxID=2490863 RepID=A0A455SQH0_9CHLR|nr:hypothetical protein KTC_46070 [Thermosporothrix sp. COM3]GCE48052.1 hypothetical protein KTH_29210 [Thermosporothrix hazakensis]
MEGEKENVVHRNFVLIQATSTEEAYQKALHYGKSYEATYENPEGQRVVSLFRGLGDLTQVLGEPQDGEEITYYRWIGLSENEIQEMILPKEELHVFRQYSSDEDADGPDIRSKDVLEELEPPYTPYDPYDPYHREPELNAQEVLAEVERLLGSVRDNGDDTA